MDNDDDRSANRRHASDDIDHDNCDKNIAQKDKGEKRSKSSSPTIRRPDDDDDHDDRVEKKKKKNKTSKSRKRSKDRKHRHRSSRRRRLERDGRDHDSHDETGSDYSTSSSPWTSSDSESDHGRRPSSDKHHRRKKNRKKRDKQKSTSRESSDRRRKRHRRENEEEKGKSKKKTSERHRHHDDERSKERKHHKRSTMSKSSHDKKRKSNTRRSRSSSSEDDTSDHRHAGVVATGDGGVSIRTAQFAEALRALLTTHPDLAAELPCIFIRMAGGTTLDLNRMTDDTAARGLRGVFESLTTFGVVRNRDDHNSDDDVDDDVNGSWTWKDDDTVSAAAGSHQQGEKELVLIKIARYFLNEMGITMDAVEEYEGRVEQEQRESELRRQQREKVTRSDTSEGGGGGGESAVMNDVLEIENMVRKLLEKFEEKNPEVEKERNNGNNNETPSLANEIGGLCKMILDGEIVVLDGIENLSLKRALEELFATVGLEKSEIEDEDSDDEDDDENENEDVTTGYGLPDENNEGERLEQARAKIMRIVNVCRERQRGRSGVRVGQEEKRVVKGPTLGPFAEESHRVRNDIREEKEEDDDDDEGPAPAGSELTKKRQLKGPVMPPEMVKAMAERRRQELRGAISGDVQMSGTTEKGATAGGFVREEWMLEPGEHDLLQGIKTGSSLKNRKFKNEKNRGGRGRGEEEPPLNPRVQAELDAIKQAHAEARGPSLMEQHQAKKAEEKEAAKRSGKDREWKWNREKDLDRDRRVDKDALHMVLGGAATQLKSKFQGGFSSGFM